MTLHKNWFVRLSAMLLCILLMLSAGMAAVKLSSLLLLLTACALGAALWLLCPRSEPSRKLTVYLTAFILAASLVLRLASVFLLPVQPAGDFGVYVDTAAMMAKGTLQQEGAVYCDYIATFPHVAGYAWLLSGLFLIFGRSTAVYGIMNALMGTITAALCGDIARRTAGRSAGLMALAIAAFWPSSVLYTPFAASEYPFTLMMLLVAWLMMERTVPRMLAVSLLLGLSSVIRPMAAIMLIACIIPLLMEKGSRRYAVLLAAVYLLLSQLLGGWVAKTIERDTSSGVTTGYSVMVGVNTESSGMWNEADDQIRYSAYDETGTAKGAGDACMDIAITRMKNLTPGSAVSLALRKIGILWDNDNYASEGLRWYLSQQGALSARMEQLLGLCGSIGSVMYIMLLLMCIPYGWLMLRRGVGFEMTLPLFFLGTTALHLLMEVQTRYHYAVLPMMAVMAAQAWAKAAKEARRDVLG